VVSLAGALAHAQRFLLEPADAARKPPRTGEPHLAAFEPEHLEVGVLGLSRRCGASTVARGLALALSVPGARSSHVIAVSPRAGSATAGGSTGGVSQWDVPPSLIDSTEIAEYGGMVARLAGRPAAHVWDIDPSRVERAALVIGQMDRVLAVADGTGEPSLAELVTDMLSERFGSVLLVANRARDAERWDRRAIACLPESRIAAALVARGRRPGGAYWAALSELRALVEGAR
jgi:hypothetical protein